MREDHTERGNNSHTHLKQCIQFNAKYVLQYMESNDCVQICKWCDNIDGT
jgi:hypothetical protein